eukprot:s3540_g2.t3
MEPVEPERSPRRNSPRGRPPDWPELLAQLPAPAQDWAEETHRVTQGLCDAIDAINARRSRPLRFGTPCAGFEAPYFALRRLGVQNFEQRFVVDVGKHVMSSYYGEVWPTYGVELDSFEVPSDEGRRTETSGWSQWSMGGRRRQDEANAEWFEIGSNGSGQSSNASWWKDDSWVWGSWDGSSNGSHENWTYVTRREPGDHWDRSDPWHRWHRAPDGALGSGEVQRSGEVDRHERDHHGHSGESEGDDQERGGLPSGNVVSVHEKADKEEEKKSSGKVSNSYPPVFRARQGESYRDWKRSVKFWLHGEGQQLPTALVGSRVMVQLRDRAAQLVKHLEPEDVSKKDGLDKIFMALERSPLIKQSEKHRVDWHRKRLLSLSRLSGESLESYITRAGLYRSQLEGLDASLSMGERFYVGHLLDHARLTRRDKAMIKTHAGCEDEESITTAMMELSAELEGEQGFPIGQSEAQLGGAQGEEHLVQRGVMGFRFNKKDKAALMAEIHEAESETNVSLEGLPEDPVGDESVDDGEAMPTDVLHAEHEALALQFRAKQKMAEARKMRNFYKRTEGDSKKNSKGGKCFVCDEHGHYARDCPKVKAGLAAAPNTVLVTSNGSESDPKSEWDLLQETLCKDSLRNEPSEREVYMVQRVLGDVKVEDKTPKYDTPVVPFEAWWSMQELSRKVILDLGCMRNVVGVRWANDVVSEWQQHQRWFRVLEEEEVFRFGDGNTLKSKFRLQLQATFGGKLVLLAFSVVPGPCPPLLSKQSHTQLGVQIDTEHHTLSSRKLHVKNYGLSETKAGHYTVPIDEFHVVTEAGEADQEYSMEAHQEVGMIPRHEVHECEVFGSKHMQFANDQPTADVVNPQSSIMSCLRRSRSPHERLPGHLGTGVGAGSGFSDRREFSRSRTVSPTRGGATSRTQSSSEVDGGGCPEGQGARCSGSSCGGDGKHYIHVDPYGNSEDGAKGQERAYQQGAAALRGRDPTARDSGHRIHSRVDRQGAGDYPQETGQGAAEGGGEAVQCSSDGDRIQVPLSEQCLERRLGLQHSQVLPDAHPSLSLEEAGMATSSQGGDQSGVEGQSSLEAQCEVAQPAVECGGGVSMGPFRSDATEASDVGLFEFPTNWHRCPPQRGLIQKLKKGMGEVCAQQALVATIGGLRPHYLVLELFAGCARLTSVASTRKGWKAMAPVDLIYGHDLKNVVTQNEVLQQIRTMKPDLVTMSPRCGPWSQMQRINPNIDKVMEDRKEDIPLWRFCRKVWDEQDQNGRLALTENPSQSLALTLDFMVDRPNLHRAKIPQCAFGLCDVISEKPHQKYTALDVNDAGMREALMEGAVCTHTPEEHQPIEGNVYYEGRWQKRSALAAKWPKPLCEHILRAAEKAWEKCDRDAPRKLTDGRDVGMSHYVLPVEPLPTPEGELRRQLEKADWRGGQYDYVYFDGVARQSPHKLRQALAHLHVVLGHPSMERLVRMLLISGCSKQVVEAAHGLRCQICQAVRPPGAEPKVSIQRPTRFGERVLSDSFYVWDIKNERFNVGADVTTELLQNRWCAVLGPPEVFQTDGGKEYEDVVQRISRLLDFRHEVVPPGAKWRQGQVERHGAVIKLMMMRVIATQQAAGLEEIKLVAASCFNAKNRLCNRMGLSPMQAVTGKNVQVPVSVMEQLCSGNVKFPMNEELGLRDSLRRAERIRAAAIDSYNWIDSNQIIREALNRRSRPPKLEGTLEGTTVYVHEPPPNRRGQHRRLQDHSSWDGPGLVVCVERQQDGPNRVWVRIRGKVRSYPLEKLRLATPDEMLGSQFIVQILEDMQEEIKKGNICLEENRNVRPSEQKTLADVPQTALEHPQPEQANEMLDDLEVQQRLRRVRRMEAINDVPDSVRQGITSSSSQSSRALVRRLDRDERQQLLEEDENMLEPPAADEPMEPSRLKFPEKKALFEKGRRTGELPSTLTEARVRSGMGLASNQVKNIRKMIHKQRRAPMTPQARQRRAEEQSTASMVMMAEVLQADDLEVLWQVACAELEEQEAFWNDPEVKKKSVERINKKIQDKVDEYREDLRKAKIVTGKARLEYQWSKLDEKWRKAYEQPLVKAVQIYFAHDALVGVPRDKVIDPKRILSTRFVLTNKGGPELEEAVLKARLILGGHQDPDMGKYPTLAPTAALLDHNLINWIAVQKGWIVKQNPETLEFEYSMDEYAKDLQKMKIPTGEAKEASTEISHEEKLEMASILGQLNWMSRQGRYDLSYGVSHVQQLAAREGRVALEWLNKVVYRAKQPAVQVVKKLKDWRNFIVVSASDAAYGGQPGGYSQGGLVIGLADKEILEGDATIAVVEAASMKIQRVVRCSMSAEVSMAATAFEHGDFVRAALAEILNKDFDLPQWKVWSSARPHYLVIDAKTGFDVLNNESQTSDRKVQIDLEVLKQAMTEEDINAFARWVPGHHMIADGTTKWYDNGALGRALAEGKWSLKDTPEAQDLRREAARKRQMYRKAARTDQRGSASKFSNNLQHAKHSWLGPTQGDLLRLDLSKLPAVDVLIAGPPCPPWSSAGSRKGTKDPRAEVFWRVIDLIAELVRRPGDDSLRCFVLENVEGIKFDTPGGRGIDEVLRRLRESVPAFKIRIYDMNSQDYSLPQSRARVYIVGVHKSLEVRGRSFCTPYQCSRRKELATVNSTLGGADDAVLKFQADDHIGADVAGAAAAPTDATHLGGTERGCGRGPVEGGDEARGLGMATCWATVASYNSLLAQHAAAEEWQHALRLLATKEADALSFSSSMSACQKSLQWSKVQRWVAGADVAAQHGQFCPAVRPGLPEQRRGRGAELAGLAESGGDDVFGKRGEKVPGRLLLDEITCSETLTLCASSKQWLVAEVLLAQMALEAFPFAWQILTMETI